MKISFQTTGTPGKVMAVRTMRVALADMNPTTYNPRVITEEEKAGLSGSIDEFGLVEMIVWNIRSKNIVGGHQRYFDLKDKGYTETDVSVVDLSLSREKALNLVLNNHKAQGKFVNEKVNALLGDLRVAKFNLQRCNLHLLETQEADPNAKVIFSCSMTETQREYVTDTLAKIKKDFGSKNNGDALLQVFHTFNGTSAEDVE